MLLISRDANQQPGNCLVILIEKVQYYRIDNDGIRTGGVITRKCYLFKETGNLPERFYLKGQSTVDV